MPPALKRKSAPRRVASTAEARLSAWPTLLLVDSDFEVARGVVCHFEKRGFHVAAAANLAEAREYVHRRKTWTLVIADCHLPDGMGWELQASLKELGGKPPFIFVSSSPFAATLCADADFLAKPFSLAKLEARVKALTGR